nr:IS66 family transposase [Budvicia aquatica]
MNHKTELCRFLDDGGLPLDNNRCERAIRPVVMGRSNWLCVSRRRTDGDNMKIAA